MFDDLEKDIRVSLALPSRPMRNGYAGRSPGSRGDTAFSTKTIAEDVSKRVYRSYHFHEAGRRVGGEELLAEIHGTMSAVPMELRLKYADKLGINSQPAAAEIAAKIFQTLSQKWAISYHPVFARAPAIPDGTNHD
ncbi:hypothetical protein [Rhizobium sp. RM]|uniref:hypothetical protein n=1 Tax=Rhizobium sp. RM TaxID=2748079 RepID=UPI00110F0DCD|nr:hypothetical protein [Rhizobium sp. RM]NWJ24784.1 hypothetical protein [Rhizobium sp. RM]TMV16583.1 hypothetical protein BJG94_19300 [Rhizobium sp. Td3]